MTKKQESVLITGADGFIGSHLTELLVREGYKVKALSQYNSFNYWGWLEDIECRDQIEVLSGDVRDPHYCKHITKDVDIVFHLAALIAIPYSYVAPDSYVDTNIKGTLNICQAAMENGVKRVIHTSTSEVYGTAQYVPIDEKHPLQPQSPYSASKIGADAMAMSFFNAFNLPVTIARPFNTYGPRQSARAVIPTIITQIANGKKQIKLGDVSPTRDFNYVLDTCRGFLELARCDKAIGETVNIGSNYEISVGDTLVLIRELMGKLALARQFGAEVVDLAAGQDPVKAAELYSRGRGVDAVIVTAATKSSEPMHQAALMCRKRGRIVLVGVTGLELSRDDFFKKELTFQVSASYGPGRYDPNYEEKGQDYPVGFVRWTEQRNFEAVLDMMADGRLDVKPLISHRFAIEEAEQAYALGIR